ncbi:hypothetical protein EJ08DRAFT_650658 [Tothia fuscella]|uniref:SnoaL-like domain-containing protein n=1 Tax=Tothia fuscella TaxID=1048955 RepID=A0A9P4TXA9_9PEZI|nr:hypothetical protein EJ08DRAFT_650658 [Tothia fuscella]
MPSIPLTPRESVTEAVQQMLLALDRDDVELFSAAYAGEDTVFEMNGTSKTTLNGVSAVVTLVFDLVGPMDSTHMITNIKVDVKDGANTAFLSCYVLAQHAAPGKGWDCDSPKYLVGGTYAIDLVKDEAQGVWKIRKFALEVLWNQGDPSVMQKPV